MFICWINPAASCGDAPAPALARLSLALPFCEVTGLAAEASEAREEEGSSMERRGGLRSAALPTALPPFCRSLASCSAAMRSLIEPICSDARSVLSKLNERGKETNQGRGTANQDKPRRGKHPHLSRQATIKITMNNLIHITTGRGKLHGGKGPVYLYVHTYTASLVCITAGYVI